MPAKAGMEQKERLTGSREREQEKRKCRAHLEGINQE